MLAKGLLREYSHIISLLTRSMDMLIVSLAAWLAYFFRFHNGLVDQHYIGAILIGLLTTTVIFTFFHIYESIRSQSFVEHTIRLIQAVFVLSLTLAGMAFFTRSGAHFSRLWFVAWMGIALVLLILLRCSVLLILRFMRARGLNEKRIAIMGAGVLGINFANAVQLAVWTGFRIVTFIDDFVEDKPKFILDIPVIETPKDLGDYLEKERIDEIWLALPLRAEVRVKEILFDLRHHTIPTRFVLNIFSLDLLNHSLSDVAGFPVLNIRTTPMMGLNRFMKAIEDRLLALFILLLISPLLSLIAIGVKLSSKGPIFFKQQRLGWDGRVIKVYKFRTMFLHKETKGLITQATFDDWRVTKFGKFLRRSSLDELPQFFNVLQGRMSIVGPRPHALQHNELYKDSITAYMQRYHVKPGITGWAQINGWRGETDTLLKMQKRVEYDLYYINNWSLWFDLKIIFLTLFQGFFNHNAY